MEKRCEKHIFEESEDRCGKCGHEYCAECLVYSFGPKKPPFCIPCAVAAAGIRSTAGNAPLLGKRDMKVMHRERTRAFKRLSRTQQPTPVADDPMPSPAPAGMMPSTIAFPQAL